MADRATHPKDQPGSIHKSGPDHIIFPQTAYSPLRTMHKLCKDERITSAGLCGHDFPTEEDITHNILSKA
ncbi:hypothetical protein YC2023_066112 [Brassica napus]